MSVKQQSSPLCQEAPVSWPPQEEAPIGNGPEHLGLVGATGGYCPTQGKAMRLVPPAVEAVTSMGIPEQVVNLAIELQRMKHGKDFPHVQNLYLAAWDVSMQSEEKQEQLLKEVLRWQADQEKSQAKENSVTRRNRAHRSKPAVVQPSRADRLRKLKRLMQRNKSLKRRKFCRACKHTELAASGITFLPCGHFIMCEQCADKFDDCPACGQNIMGTVRTFLA